MPAPVDRCYRCGNPLPRRSIAADPIPRLCHDCASPTDKDLRAVEAWERRYHRAWTLEERDRLESAIREFIATVPANPAWDDLIALAFREVELLPIRPTSEVITLARALTRGITERRTDDCRVAWVALIDAIDRA